ncbi:putative integral membrane protein [Leishmania donovani]|uniref:Putative integral membrane protein n=1 Tax=Leishmania donovani TaxID=5661 RepID=A0A504X074_LEIDO|nr:putative integral membrane protein [Leishmania donovani]
MLMTLSTVAATTVLVPESSVKSRMISDHHRGTTSEPIDIPGSSFALEFSPVPMVNVASLIQKLSAPSPSVANPSTTAQITAVGLYSNEYPDGGDGANNRVVFIVMSRTRPTRRTLTEAEENGVSFRDIARDACALAAKCGCPSATGGRALSEACKRRAKAVLNTALMAISAATLIHCMKNVPAKMLVEEGTTGGTHFQQNRRSRRVSRVGIAIAFFDVGMITVTDIVFASVRCQREAAPPATSSAFRQRRMRSSALLSIVGTAFPALLTLELP